MGILARQNAVGQVVGRTKRSAVPAIGRTAGTALRLVRPTDSTPIRWLDTALAPYASLNNTSLSPGRVAYKQEVFVRDHAAHATASLF